MPALWPNYKSSIIKEVEKDIILWELYVFAKEPSLPKLTQLLM
jgi:hypothetical protein